MNNQEELYPNSNMIIYTTEDGLTKIETTFAGNHPTLKEATVAKNYLNEKELRSMGQLVSGYQIQNRQYLGYWTL